MKRGGLTKKHRMLRLKERAPTNITEAAAMDLEAEFESQLIEPEPTEHPAGTAQKLATLAARVANGFELWSDDDNDDYSGCGEKPIKPSATSDGARHSQIRI